MKREQLPAIGIKDRTGEDIRIGDIFEYENLYIILPDKITQQPFIYEYENQVEYGVDKEPYYILVGSYLLYELDLANDQIKDNIFLNPEIRKQLHLQ